MTATLEGPDEWRFDGKFSFSILWWDKTIPFHEHFGEVRQAATGTASLGQALQAELGNPDNVTVEVPTGANPVTLTSAGTGKLAHPVGRLAIRQRAVPLGLLVERLGTRELAGGPQAVTVATVALNGEIRNDFEHTTDQFSRGQFVTLTDDEKLTGTDVRVVPGRGHRRVGGLRDERRAGPRRGGRVRDRAPRPRAGGPRVEVDDGGAGVPAGDATRGCWRRRSSARRPAPTAPRRRLRVTSPLVASSLGVDEPPLALVGPASLAESGVAAGCRGDDAVTGRTGRRRHRAAGRRAVRGHGVSTPAVYRFLPFTRRGLVAELRDDTAAATGDLPQRASIKLDVTLSGGLGGASTTTALAGPGDVVGLDPRSIVRLTPRRDATNVEPNYLVAVDFDEPDLPWLLTPAAADAQGRLRPWLALVVVEARDRRVDRGASRRAAAAAAHRQRRRRRAAAT